MIPLKDDNPTVHVPIVTYALITVNCLVHIYQMILSPYAAQMFVFQYGLIPVEITRFTDLTPEIPFPIWLSPFSSMFLHGDLWHLGGNMLYLWIFGNNVEDHLGHAKFLIFYLASGLAAVTLFILFDPSGRVPMVGASGAIAGILGAYMVLYPRARVFTLIWIIFIIRLVWLPAVFILGYWFVIQLVMGMSAMGQHGGEGVAWFAHVGGFAFGWLLFRGQRRHRSAISGGQNSYYSQWH